MHECSCLNLSVEDKVFGKTLLEEECPISEVAMVLKYSVRTIYRNKKKWETLPPHVETLPPHVVHQ